MVNIRYTLPVFIVFCAILLSSSSCVAQDFNPRIPKLPKWNLDGLQKIPRSLELFKTTPEIIAMRGYPSESHYVTTKDGYIIELHRIPAKSANRKPVYLQHGVFQKSNEWVISPSSRSLAFQLSDLGFDVWLGNVRGGIYGKNHITLNPENLEFWNFAWDEVGHYDIPAIVEYILKITDQPKLICVGYSLGPAFLFIALIDYPELNDKIEMVFGLGPVACSRYFNDLFPKVSKNIETIRYLLALQRPREVFYQSPLVLRIQNILCGQKYFKAYVCRSFINLVIGPNPENIHLEEFPVILSSLLTGTSLDTMLQFFQNYNKGFVFNAFDYGAEENMRRYGTETPKTYDLKQVSTPVHIFYSENDYIANATDVEWVANSLGNLQTYHRVLNLKYNHLDFLFGIDVNEMVYQPMFSLLPSPITM